MKEEKEINKNKGGSSPLFLSIFYCLFKKCLFKNLFL